MNGADLRAYREKRGWTQKQLAELLNSGLERRYQATKVSKWERDQEGVPKIVASFLADLRLEEAFPSEPPPLEGDYEPVPETEYAPPDFATDTAPPAPPGQDTPPRPQLPLSSSGTHARVCEELWEMVATGVGLVGAATGSDALKRDGEIILADKKALGRAYGKLADTNDTFRKMLVASTGGGAWLEVALVSGLTAGKLMRNHQSALPAPADFDFAEQSAQPDGVVSFNGDGGVVTFPPAA